MLKIRLQRVGRKHEPSFRLVLTDSKNSTKSGRVSEMLGSYDPRKSTEALKSERIKHWLSLGADPTASVNNLLIKKGIIRGKKIDVSARSAAPQESATIEEVSADSEALADKPAEEKAEEKTTE